MSGTVDTDATRQICRLGGIYLIDRARFLARTLENNFVTALVFMAICRANVGGIAGSSAASAKYLSMRDVPTNESRIPVTVYALARDLAIPYETVRRHVAKLKAWGTCAALADGIIVRSEVFQSPEARNGTLETERATRVLVDEMARSGVRASPHPPIINDATLQLARLSTHYFVEGVSLVARRTHLDVLSTLVMLTIGLMNTRTIACDRTLADRYAGLHDVPPDDLRAPVKAYAISRFLMLPYETARRTCLRLTERGLVVRNETGEVTMPSDVFARPEMMDLFIEFARLTETFLENLAIQGVTAQIEPARRFAPDRAAASGVAWAL